MKNTPNKELVRAWLQRRLSHPGPPPELARIRLDVGWSSVGAAQKAPALTTEQAEELCV